ncbi:AraC family transcriptional regulator [Ferrimonas balearica]|uniref:AraC family transcriptional regulator n=1 Tax=Ferrimonas balearica TaxID=44012 RepID=UPI001C946DB8|nr:AraC family transcriptional regulator [Ferrimonas balearica]MBY6225560.1 AraC family transcriptional regulator [Ferrimonas balearica]
MKRLALWQDKCMDGQLLPLGLWQLFRLRQLDGEALLRGTGLFATDLQHPGLRVSPRQLCALLSNARKLWPGDDLAFLLGQHWLPSQSGALTNGLLCAPDLERALSFWGRYHWLSQPWLRPTRWHQDDHSHWQLQLDLGLQTHHQFLLELALSTLTATAKRLSPRPLHFHIQLPYPAPAHPHHYWKYLGPEVQFGAAMTRISLPRVELQRPLPGADLAGFQLAWRQCRQRLQAEPWQRGLPAAVLARLERPQHQGDALPQIAKDLATSPATLKRRLKAFGLAFQPLQDQARLGQALYLLSIQGAANADVARQLQFADGGNFRRSFKRWTGLLPSQFSRLT